MGPFSTATKPSAPVLLVPPSPSAVTLRLVNPPEIHHRRHRRRQRVQRHTGDGHSRVHRRPQHDGCHRQGDQQSRPDELPPPGKLLGLTHDRGRPGNDPLVQIGSGAGIDVRVEQYYEELGKDGKDSQGNEVTPWVEWFVDVCGLSLEWEWERLQFERDREAFFGQVATDLSAGAQGALNVILEDPPPSEPSGQ